MTKVVAGVPLPYPVSVGCEMLDYLRLCLLLAAGVPPSLDHLATPQLGAPAVGAHLRSLMAEAGGKKKDLVIKYVSFAEKLLSAQAGMQPALALLQGIGCVPTEMAPR